MKISIVIPFYNCADSIGQCLDHFRKQKRMPDEILLVDNGSTDETVRIVKEFMSEENRFETKLLFESERGPAACRNTGIRASTGDVVAFTDADCLVHEAWVENILKAFLEDDQLAVVGGVDESFVPLTKPSEKLLSAVWLPPAKHIQKSLFSNKEDLFHSKFLCTFNCAFKKSMLEKLDCFDTKFNPAGEDLDLLLRACEKGGKIIVWDENLRVCHRQDLGFKQMCCKAFNYGTGLAHIVKEHFSNQIIIKGFFNKSIRFYRKGLTIVSLDAAPKLLALIFFLAISLFISMKTFLITLFFFLTFLYLKIASLVRKKGHSIKLSESFFIFFCYICRDITEELGRIYGSFKYKVICL